MVKIKSDDTSHASGRAEVSRRLQAPEEGVVSALGGDAPALQTLTSRAERQVHENIELAALQRLQAEDATRDAVIEKLLGGKPKTGGRTH